MKRGILSGKGNIQALYSCGENSFGINGGFCSGRYAAGYLFGGANAYLGLRVGMTISASIPAAVISMAVIRVLLKRDSILENNMVQTIGSAGESVAAGCIFTLPAMFMWAQEWGAETPSMVEIAIVAFIGGVLGVLFMVPLRKALIVKEHGVLPYPEGTACAEILLAGEGKESSAKTILQAWAWLQFTSL